MLLLPSFPPPRLLQSGPCSAPFMSPLSTQLSSHLPSFLVSGEVPPQTSVPPRMLFPWISGNRGASAPTRPPFPSPVDQDYYLSRHLLLHDLCPGQRDKTIPCWASGHPPAASTFFCVSQTDSPAPTFRGRKHVPAHPPVPRPTKCGFVFFPPPAPAPSPVGWVTWFPPLAFPFPVSAVPWRPLHSPRYHRCGCARVSPPLPPPFLVCNTRPHKNRRAPRTALLPG